MVERDRGERNVDGEAKVTGPDLGEEGIPASDLVLDVPVKGQVDGNQVIVVRTAAGLCAVAGSCTHYHGPLGDGLCVDGQVRCPWHHARFDLSTGEAVGGPALNPLKLYRAEERDGKVFVEGPVEAPALRRTPPVSPDSVVIVGSGAAGAAAAEILRREGYTGPVTMIGIEPPIDRPNVSKDYLAGTAPEDWMPLRSPQFYDEHGIDLITGTAVAAIDTAEQTVNLEDGREIVYGALLIATGAEPQGLPVTGSDRPQVHYVRTLEDSKAIIAALDDVERAVVIGAGFIGLEVAASLRQREVEVTVVAPEDVLLGQIVGEHMGTFVQALHEEHGVEFRLGRTVSTIESDQVELDDGTRIPAGLVVIGVGVKPRTALAEEAGLNIDDGIVVDERLRTSDPNVWAAGDIASYPDQNAGRVRIEHWVLAERQGQAAARNILGHDRPFTDPPFFWSQHYDVPINVVGHAENWDEEVVAGDPRARDVLIGYRKDGAIQAVASIYRDVESLRAEHALENQDQETLERLLAR
jgi:NADPH-dependent 2,4-dienoyl-CoA reductase/sulfur reductase-like enzyme/nitrite reductase/ring-hydroxylating ferredoxin subunit